MKKVIDYIVLIFIGIQHRLEGACRRAYTIYYTKKFVCEGPIQFEGRGYMVDPLNIEFGADVTVGRNFFFRGTGKITVGDYTHISRNVTLHTTNHNYNGELLPFDAESISGPIEIGKAVWIGMNVSVLPGVSIGDYAIVGMGSVVTKSVPPNAIVGGNPAAIIGWRRKQHTNHLAQKNRFLKLHTKRE